MSPLLGALIGSLVAAGGLLVVVGWRGHALHLPGPVARMRMSEARRRQLMVAIAAGIGTGVVTGWPIAAAGVAAAVWVGPRVFGGQAAGHRELARLEALATWIESLRDTIAGSMSLEQAIPTSLSAADDVLAEPLSNLVAALRTRTPLPEALTRFADELDDASADLVVAALILNARLRGPGLEATLTELAGHAREELEQRQVVETGRKSLHRNARMIASIVAVFIGALLLFSSDYLTPYATVQGQIVLGVIAAVFAFAFMRLRNLAETTRVPRFLATAPTREAATR